MTLERVSFSQWTPPWNYFHILRDLELLAERVKLEGVEDEMIDNEDCRDIMDKQCWIKMVDDLRGNIILLNEMILKYLSNFCYFQIFLLWSFLLNICKMSLGEKNHATGWSLNMVLE